MLVVLSPHIDDAALSAGGAIVAAFVAGEHVTIVSIFTDGANADVRKEEDRAAAAILGANVVHVGLLDAPERLGLARTREALVTARLDEPDVDTTYRVLDDALRPLRPARVLAPLGVGGHVDHRVVFECARRLVERSALTFYEDRPYAFADGALSSRLADLAPVAFTSSIARYDEAVAARVHSAILAYASQIPVLFGRAADVRAAYRAASNGEPHEERTFTFA